MVHGIKIFEAADLDKDLILLENMRQSRKDFVEQLCAASKIREETVLAILRSEAAYQFAEFFYLLRARSIDSVDALQSLAEMHNDFLVELAKDKVKMARLGLRSDRVLDAMFTADTLPRLLQGWRERAGTFDQSNLSRFLLTVMSSETCRKVVVACHKAGFLTRERTAYGTTVVYSNGSLENIYGSCLRQLRVRLSKIV